MNLFNEPSTPVKSEWDHTKKATFKSTGTYNHLWKYCLNTQTRRRQLSAATAHKTGNLWLNRNGTHFLQCICLVRDETEHSWVEAGMYWWSIVKDKRTSKSPWLIAKDLSFWAVPATGSSSSSWWGEIEAVCCTLANQQLFFYECACILEQKMTFALQRIKLFPCVRRLFPIKTTQRKCKPWKSMQYWKLQETLQELGNCLWCTYM